jgi:hypothetical protein
VQTTRWTGGYDSVVQKIKKSQVCLRLPIFILAGAVGLEPTTNGFGDRYSTD